MAHDGGRMPTAAGDELVLVTGGAGFIGSHTVEALVRSGWRVRVLDSFDPQVHGTHGADRPVPAGVEVLRGDVRDPARVDEALDGASVVVHLAALTGVGQSMYETHRYTDVNVTGTASLLDAVVRRRGSVRRLVLASSRAVYGEGTHLCGSCGPVYPGSRSVTDLEAGRFTLDCPSCGGDVTWMPTAEDRPLRPVSVYGWTKRCQEEQCAHVAQTFAVPVSILRYFNVYGAGQSLLNPYTGIVSIFFGRLVHGQPIRLYEHGTPTRDFVHVSDVVRANLLAVESSTPGCTTVNVGSGDATTVRALAEALASVGKRQDVGLEDHGEFRLGDIHSCVADLAQARATLDYSPAVSLDDGLRDFVAWAAKQQASDRYDAMVDELRTFGLFSAGSDGPGDRTMSRSEGSSAARRTAKHRDRATDSFTPDDTEHATQAGL